MMNMVNSGINSIIVYGSYARGDNDCYSDFDLCVFKSDELNSDLIPSFVKEIIPSHLIEKLNISVYSQTNLANMLSYGSLFMWHLKLEGKILYGHDFMNEQYSNLNEFRNHLKEIEYHSILFQNLNNRYRELGLLTHFDYSLLFTIVRNISILIMHNFGSPKFGRIDSFKGAKSLFPDLPITQTDYNFLSTNKIIYSRNDIRNVDIISQLPDDYYFQIVANFIEHSYGKIRHKNR